MTDAGLQGGPKS